MGKLRHREASVLSKVTHSVTVEDKIGKRVVCSEPLAWTPPCTALIEGTELRADA